MFKGFNLTQWENGEVNKKLTRVHVFLANLIINLTISRDFLQVNKHLSYSSSKFVRKRLFEILFIVVAVAQLLRRYTFRSCATAYLDHLYQIWWQCECNYRIETKMNYKFVFQMINKSDQLLPYFVMEIAGQVPGFPGIFMSGVFSAALR